MLKQCAQLDAKEGYFRIDALPDNIPVLADFLEAQVAGIKAMLTGILVAFLATTLSFWLVFHVDMIEQVYYGHKWILSHLHTEIALRLLSGLRRVLSILAITRWAACTLQN